ncbi:hypothetical protein J4P02_21455 [Pseudomonas sp. NFXW11]|uniref:alpha/beta hydrolase family protein n=1 Tax=Pseudomonas sp. NFXW11 TaxID=2819531 RepID=UPI003CE840D3
MKSAKAMASGAVLMLGLAGASHATLPAQAGRSCEWPPLGPQVRQLPAPGGSRCVGKAGFVLLDPARRESFASEPEARRELALKIWYPVANPGQGLTRAEYAEPEALAALQEIDGKVHIASHSLRDAPMEKNRQYPVLLFSPGLGAVAEFYSGLLEDLASRGYVVVAINHPHISGMTVLPGGRVIPLLKALESDDRLTASAAQVVVDDLRSTLDWLQQRHQEPGHLLQGHLDLTRVGALGHSFGGSAALQATRVDSRLRAAANLDGSIQGDLAGPWVKPLLLYAAGNDPQDPSMEQLWQAHQGPGVRKVLKQAGHHDFTDGRWVLSAKALEAMGDQFGPIDRDLALRTLRLELGGFFARYVARRI